MECKKERNLVDYYFPNDMERGYDRSIDNFIRIYKERGFSCN
jgi:hypothetical protein